MEYCGIQVHSQEICDMNLPCLAVAAVICAITVAASWIWAKRGQGKETFLSPVKIMFAGVLLASLALMYPASYLQVAEEYASWPILRIVAALLMSGQYAVRWFLLDGDHQLLLEAVCEPLQLWYYVLGSILLVWAPALTFTVVINFFKNITSGLRLLRARNRDVYVFSALTPRSLVLARDIRRNHPKAILVFTDLSEEAEGGFELEQEAGKLKAICFRRDILALNIGRQRPGKNLWFFVIGENEQENMTHALILAERYGDRANARMYVFSRGLESEVLMASAQNKAMKIRRVNHVRNLIHRELYENGYRFFEEARPAPDGKKQISAVVVGMNAYGTNMVRALSWFCQMDGYHIRIDAFDQDPDAEDRFAAQSPDLISPVYNGVRVEGEVEYTIRIHSGCNLSSKRFADAISKLDGTTYVFVSLGSDEENIKAALRLRMLFARLGIYPRIQAVVYDSDKKEALKDIRNFKDQPYNIECVGDLESTYTESVILDSELEKDALRRHMAWLKLTDKTPEEQAEAKRQADENLNKVFSAFGRENVRVLDE